MLTKLLPSQISEYWDTIAKAIESSAPPYTYSSQMRLSEVLTAMLADDMHCWIISGSVENGTSNPLGICVTAFLEDYYSKARNLLIYSLWGFENISEEVWLKGLASIKKFAKAKDCRKIIAYSDIPAIIKRIEMLGGDSSIRFISMEVE